MKELVIIPPKTQTGLSLIELMVALLISSILLLGVLELFGSSSKTQRSANAVARLQENGRLVMDLIAREARRTGFYGCDTTVGDSGEVNFGAEGGGKITLPDESLKDSDATSLTFRYLGSSDGLKKAAGTTECSREKLDVEATRYFIRFYNCGKNLCVKSKGMTKEEALLNHANIKEVRYIQPCEAPNQDKICTYKKSDIPTKLAGGDTSFANVQKVLIKLELCTDTLRESNGSSSNYCKENNGTRITRTFNSLIELRNRL